MKNEKKNNNIINFPNSLTNGEREVEAILFAASEPLEIESIEARLNKKVDLKVCNSLGDVVISKNNTNAIDVSKMSPGIYNIQIKHNNNITNKKIIKK